MNSERMPTENDLGGMTPEPDAPPPRRPASPDCRLAVAGFVVGGCAVYLAMVAGGVL